MSYLDERFPELNKVLAEQQAENKAAEEAHKAAEEARKKQEADRTAQQSKLAIARRQQKKREQRRKHGKAGTRKRKK